MLFQHASHKTTLPEPVPIEKIFPLKLRDLEAEEKLQDCSIVGKKLLLPYSVRTALASHFSYSLKLENHVY